MVAWLIIIITVFVLVALTVYVKVMGRPQMYTKVLLGTYLSHQMTGASEHERLLRMFDTRPPMWSTLSKGFLGELVKRLGTKEGSSPKSGKARNPFLMMMISP